jgi:hypothetical protein
MLQILWNFKSMDQMLRWYMISNANPWDNLSLTWKNCCAKKILWNFIQYYSFFSLYTKYWWFAEAEIPSTRKTRNWSMDLELNTLIKEWMVFAIMNLLKQLEPYLNLFRKTWVTGTFVCAEDASGREYAGQRTKYQTYYTCFW